MSCRPMKSTPLSTPNPTRLSCRVQVGGDAELVVAMVLVGGGAEVAVGAPADVVS